ncbi:radical SAM protein [Candidatus Thorarchaeota archaeon]|nr:MAG: radical SAM protein [Candidatus Thorarchaeota archaeon]
MVLFVTGLCNSSCYYCPLSDDKAGTDIVFADEMPVSCEEDIIFEVNSIQGEGAGISGGDPLCRLDRTLHYIQLLKEVYGPTFHIHLYTSKTNITLDELRKLVGAGLDEIRFHPQNEDWSGIEDALSFDIHVGIEVPAIPGEVDKLKGIAKRAEGMGIAFLNINELEASETNFARLTSLNMRLTDMGSSSIEGSQSTARAVLEWGSENLKKISLHFCSASYKDGVQLRNRLERRLVQTRRGFEERDDSDPLLIVGIIRAPYGSSLSISQLKKIQSILQDRIGINQEDLNLDLKRMRIELAPWILADIPDTIKKNLREFEPLEIGISYEYPSWDRLQTLFEPV